MNARAPLRKCNEANVRRSCEDRSINLRTSLIVNRNSDVRMSRSKLSQNWRKFMEPNAVYRSYADFSDDILVRAFEPSIDCAVNGQDFLQACRNTCPSGVRVTPLRPPRSNKLTLSFFSKALICCETALCEIDKMSPAREKLPVSASAEKTFRDSIYIS